MGLKVTIIALSILLALVTCTLIAICTLLIPEVKRLKKLLSDAQFQKTELEKKNILLNSEIEKAQAPNQTGFFPEVYNLIASWCKEAGVKQVAAKVKTEPDGTRTLIVYSERPGCLIGKAGCVIDKYTNAIKKLKIAGIQKVIIEEIYGIVNQYKIDVDRYYEAFMTGYFAYEEAGEEC